MQRQSRLKNMDLNIHKILISFGKGAIMYRVEWLDIDGEQKVMRGFKTSEEAHEWIRTHHFDMDFEMPMVFYDGE